MKVEEQRLLNKKHFKVKAYWNNKLGGRKLQNVIVVVNNTSNIIDRIRSLILETDSFSSQADKKKQETQSINNSSALRVGRAVTRLTVYWAILYWSGS